MSPESILGLNPWIAGLVLALLVGVFLLGRLVPRQAAVVHVSPSEARLNDIFDRFDQIEERLKHCEHDGGNVRMIVKDLPTRDVVKELSGHVGAIGGQLNAMMDGLKANTAAVGRLQDFILQIGAETIVNQRSELRSADRETPKDR